MTTEILLSDGTNIANFSQLELDERKTAALGTINAISERAAGDFSNLTAEDRQNWEAVNSDYDSIEEFAQQRQENAEFQARQAELAERQRTKQTQLKNRWKLPGPVVSDEQRSLVCLAWLKDKIGVDLTADETRACQALGSDPESKTFGWQLANENQLELIDRQMAERGSFVGMPTEFRDMNTGTGVGGETTLHINPGMLYQYEFAMKAGSVLRRIGTVIRNNDGNPYNFPMIDGTDGNNAARIVAESGAISKDKTLTTHSKTAKPFKYVSGFVLLTAELIADSRTPWERELPRQLGESIGRLQGAHFATGAGTTEPLGLLSDPSLDVHVAGSQTAISYDDLVMLQDGLDPAYEGNSAFVSHKKIRTLVRLLKDTQGRPIWEGSLKAGAPDVLLGAPYYLDNTYPNAAAAGGRVMTYGDHRYYRIVDGSAPRMMVARELFLENDQTGFVMMQRTDGVYCNPHTTAGFGPIWGLEMAPVVVAGAGAKQAKK